MKNEVYEAKQMAGKIRKHIITACLENGDGHAGPSLSCTDILAVLYSSIMNVDPKSPNAEDRDYFIMSAGHKCLALYGALVEKGYEDEAVLKRYNQMDCIVPGHPDKSKFRGVDFSTGSLGHGLPIACGVAFGKKLNASDGRVFVLMGDGEHGEGSVWEGASVAAHHKLNNIVAVVDRNGLQINGTTREVQNTDSLERRYEAFGWKVITVDGHDIESLISTFENISTSGDKPTVIIANTVKGKGLSFAENNGAYHHWNPKDPEEIEIAHRCLAEIESEGLLK